LKADDFFGTTKFPKASFVIGSIKNVKGDENEVTGKLTIKGITQDITFPATIKVEGKTVSAKAKITVDRTKYDIKYGSGLIGTAADKVINDEFVIDLNLVATK
jgi:polyisoprenoid-binding protein YceI